MLKIVVFDGGYGGELFADRLEEELPIVKVIRVIDWRNADKFLKNSHTARRAAMNALRPYIGRVDLIVFANHLLSATSLKFFQRKYKNQKFLGFSLPQPTTFLNRPTVILTTKALTRTISYYNYLFRLKRTTNTICLDAWSNLIDDGELTEQIVFREFQNFYERYKYRPQEVILICSQFNDAIKDLKKVLGQNIKIHDSYQDAITNIGKILRIRGGITERRH